MAHGRTVAWVVLAVSLLWWPTDYLIFRGVPQAVAPYARWRIGVALTCALYLALTYAPRLRRWLPMLAFACIALGCAIVAYYQVPVGGPEQPWFHMLYVVPGQTLVLPVPFLQRAIGTTAISVATFLAYTLPDPSYLHSPFVPLMVSFMGCTTVLSIAFGHSIYVLLRANFQQAQLLRSQLGERSGELRRMVSVLETAREDERRRVGQDLHDELGQELTALRLALGYTRNRYERDPSALAKNFEEMDRLLDRTRAATRTLITSMRPKVLDDLGLAAAVEWLAELAEGRSDVRCVVAVDPEGLAELDPAVSTSAFRIAQESITNAVRHANAQRIDVHLALRDGVVTLSVVDDGDGIAEDHRPGFGLGGMRERALARGGSFHIARRPEGGTEVRATLPVEVP